jgi:hypothetical protein
MHLMPLLLLPQRVESVLVRQVLPGEQSREAMRGVLKGLVLVKLEPVLKGATLLLEEVGLLGVFFYLVLLQELGGQ